MDTVCCGNKRCHCVYSEFSSIEYSSLFIFNEKYGGLTRYSLVLVLLLVVPGYCSGLKCFADKVVADLVVMCICTCYNAIFFPASLCLFVLSILLTHQDGWNCLHLAACGGHLDIVKDLVDQHHMNISTKTNVRRLHESYKHCTHVTLLLCILSILHFYFLIICAGFIFRTTGQLFG